MPIPALPPFRIAPLSRRSWRPWSVVYGLPPLLALTCAGIPHAVLFGWLMAIEISISGGLEHYGIHWWAPYPYALAFGLTVLLWIKNWNRWADLSEPHMIELFDSSLLLFVATISFAVGARGLAWMQWGEKAPAWLIQGWRL